MKPIIYKEGKKLKIGGRIGKIVFVNKKLKAYQIQFNEFYHEVIPFHKLERREKDDIYSRSG
jgi:hypothetical protein